MVKVTIELSTEVHSRLLDIQLERKKNPEKDKPTALNKIASELLESCVKKDVSVK